MPFLEKLRQIVLGKSQAAPVQDFSVEKDAYPQPIDFIEALISKMHDDMKIITRDKVLVPSHYTVLIHAEAHEELAPAFEIICSAAVKELTKEVDRLSKIPYGDPLDRVLDSAKRGYRRKVKKQKVEAVHRDIHPLDYTWSVELVPVLYDHDGNEAPKNYLAVATNLVLRNDAEIAPSSDEEVPVKVTVKNPFSGIYESHFVHDSSLKTKQDRRSVTISAPFKEDGKATASQPAARKKKPTSLVPPGALAVLRFQYPDQHKVHTFPITQKEIILGRETEKNGYVHLRLQVKIQVSEEHARIRWNEQQRRFEIQDVSTHGTWVNEVRVPKSDHKQEIEHWYPLEDGAKINLAGYLFLTFHV